MTPTEYPCKIKKISKSRIGKPLNAISTSFRPACSALVTTIHHVMSSFHQDLCPGTVQTPFVAEKYLIASEYRVLQPADVARAVRFVLSSPPSVEVRWVAYLAGAPLGDPALHRSKS